MFWSDASLGRGTRWRLDIDCDGLYDLELHGLEEGVEMVALVAIDEPGGREQVMWWGPVPQGAATHRIPLAFAPTVERPEHLRWAWRGLNRLETSMIPLCHLWPRVRFEVRVSGAASAELRVGQVFLGPALRRAMMAGPVRFFVGGKPVERISCRGGDGAGGAAQGARGSGKNDQ